MVVPAAQQTNESCARIGDPVTLLASAARTVTGDGPDVVSQALERARGLLLVCDVTAQSGTTPTLDVEVQTKYGSLYTKITQFSRYAAVTGSKGSFLARAASESNELVLSADSQESGSAFVQRNAPWSSTLRANYTIGGTTPSFTFSVVAYPVYW